MSTPTKTENYDLGWADCRKREVEPLREENTRLREALQRCLSYLADLNGSAWILGDGVGEIDMRQRARGLQQHVWSTLLPKQALAAGKGTSPDLSADPAAYDRIADRELGPAAGKGEKG